MTSAPGLADWHDFFLACAGAASALAGLIIVAISANITRVIAIPAMTSRGATAIAGLVLIVLVSCAGLIPGQGLAALGAEILVAALPTLAVAGRSAAHIIVRRPAGVGLAVAWLRAALGLVPTTGALAGACLLLAADGTGLYVAAVAMIAGLATSVINAWVLLVEILR